MARQFQINGETLLSIGGQAFALTDKNGIVTINISAHFDGCDVDSWGDVPPNVQYMNSDAQISASIVHYDQSILNSLIMAMMGGAGALGQTGRAGTLMGPNVNGNPNYFVALNISSPVQNLPWTFPYVYMMNGPTIPLGVRRSITQVTFQSVNYAVDPYNNGTGAQGTTLWTNS